MTGSYIVRRSIEALTVTFVVVSLTFVLIHLAPGDPFTPADPQAISEQAREILRERFGLDQPLPVQYVRFLSNLASGDLGVSPTDFRPVSEKLLQALPYTALLGVASLLFNFGIGIVVGVWQAVRFNRRGDHIASVISLTLFSLPSFWLGLLFIQIFALSLRWLPSGGTGLVGLIDPTPIAQTGQILLHLILPAVTLGLIGAAWVSRYQRAAMHDALGTEYVKAARARGIPERTVINRHALRNALLPTITLLGLSIPILFSGAVVVEVVFEWPGMGSLAANAIQSRDYPLVLGATLIASITVIAGNFLADLAYHAVDPRTRSTS